MYKILLSMHTKRILYITIHAWWVCCIILLQPPNMSSTNECKWSATSSVYMTHFKTNSSFTNSYHEHQRTHYSEPMSAYAMTYWQAGSRIYIFLVYTLVTVAITISGIECPIFLALTIIPCEILFNPIHIL